MKAFVVFAIFLLLIPIAMAENISIRNITIRLPNITINVTRVSNITILNQTRINDIIQLFGANIYEIMKDRLNRVINYALNRIVENIVSSVPHIIEILLKGNVTE